MHLPHSKESKGKQMQLISPERAQAYNITVSETTTRLKTKLTNLNVEPKFGNKKKSKGGHCYQPDLDLASFFRFYADKGNFGVKSEKNGQASEFLSVREVLETTDNVIETLIKKLKENPSTSVNHLSACLYFESILEAGEALKTLSGLTILTRGQHLSPDEYDLEVRTPFERLEAIFKQKDKY